MSTEDRLNDKSCFTSSRQIYPILPQLPLHASQAERAFNQCFHGAEWQGVAATDISYGGDRFHPLAIHIYGKTTETVTNGNTVNVAGWV